jgi:Type IIA topoisomerase (DNA gyrase/topo II, topoisomerase IV), A subunit
MGRDTKGVIGMRFREGDSLLGMDVVRPGCDVVTITDGGYAKRTKEEEWTPRGRGILGVRAMKINAKRGSLVAAMVCESDDQIFAIASNGVVIRTAVSELRPSGRDTMGVTMMRLGDEDSVVAVARSGEKADEEDEAVEVMEIAADAADAAQVADETSEPTGEGDG